MGLTTPQTKSIVSAGLFKAAAIDPEPISKAILAVAALFTQLFGFGYDPKKLNDTAITEAVKQGLNVLWYNLTGEALNGVHRTAEPGQYGAQHIALFTGSQYPNVPYPAGPADGSLIQQVIAQAQDIIAQGRSKLVRRESSAGYEFNANYMLGLMQQVADARAREPVNPLAELLPGGGKGIMSFLPWLIGGYAVYEWVL
jgi:hypothetical protein